MAIGGIPGTGKTTLIKNILSLIDDWEVHSPIKLVEGIYSKIHNLYVVGKYSPFHFQYSETFEGTDKLAMNVQPNFVSFLETTSMNVLFEGDRLFNGSLFDKVLEMDNVEELDILILDCNSEILQERYKQRNSEQTEKFISSRKTKIENITSSFDLCDHITWQKNSSLELSSEYVLNFFNIHLSQVS